MGCFCFSNVSSNLTPFATNSAWFNTQGEKQKKKKTITEKYWDWELANETKPIWVSVVTVALIIEICS
jgi:hypothetical protein